MSENRLTRQELGWLLMQEARGTAQALREGVTHLKSIPGDEPTEKGEPVESMLEALDGAIEQLGELEPPANSVQDRRGRIDVASLLFVLAPNARIALEPGAGTEVLGAESELKRMFAVLLGQPGAVGSTPTSGISVRRDGDWVRISVDMGPEGVPRGNLESRWLSRMALRQGGRVDLDRGKLSLLLPAHRASENREIEQLRKELEQAQRLGAVYARELAESFATMATAEPAAPATTKPPGNRLSILLSLSGALRRVLRPLMDELKDELRQSSPQLSETQVRTTNLARKTQPIGELLATLDRVAACGEPAMNANVTLAETIPAVVGQLGHIAARGGVELQWSADPAPPFQAHVGAVSLLVWALVHQSILATPSGQSVRVLTSQSGGGTTLLIEDGGPVIPASAISELLAGSALPQTVGRPSELDWLIAGACVDLLGAQLASSTSNSLRTLIQLTFPQN